MVFSHGMGHSHPSPRPSPREGRGRTPTSVIKRSSYESHHSRPCPAQVHATRAAPVLATASRSALCGIQVSARTFHGPLRFGLLLRRSDALPRTGWPTTRIPWPTRLGRGEGAVPIDSGNYHPAVLEVASELRARDGQGQFMAIIAGACAASRERPCDRDGTFAHLAPTETGRQDSSAAQSVAVENGLTVSLSPQRGEGRGEGWEPQNVSEFSAIYPPPRVFTDGMGHSHPSPRRTRRRCSGLFPPSLNRQTP